MPITVLAPSTRFILVCEKQIWCFAFCVGSSVIGPEHACVFFFSFHFVCVSSCSVMCVNVNHTHPVCRATRLGTDTLHITPSLFLSLAFSVSAKNILCEKVTFKLSLISYNKEENVYLPCWFSLCTQLHHFPPACCIKQGHGLLRRATSYTFPFSVAEWGHRK